MSQPKLEISSTKIYPYQSDSPLQLQGAAITANQTSLSTKFYIVKGNYGSLLGTQTATALDLLRVRPPKVTAAISVQSDNIPPSTQEIIDKFETGYQQIKLDLNSRPITTFATYQGLYRYKRLIYCICSVFESFQT